MRRNRSLWMVAAVVLVGLWAWTQQTDNGSVYAPQDVQPPAIAEPVASPRSGAANGADNRRPRPHRPASAYPEFLPPEAHAVLDAIADGGPYDYRQDGGVFQNREGLLPRQPRGYYREFTVDTPRSRDRGARRIVTGGDPPVEYFYTDDHYRSFRRFQIERDRP
ncbi:guanyl-specific ribonuclease [Novilysobacter erysipheiresistens]|uniref:Ribonuclease domain-containing protein n=1 Tax=Novilysobacter erysipheiresistens TaxID=1749332 RepID=A0ABU7YY05_9GAMM